MSSGIPDTPWRMRVCGPSPSVTRGRGTRRAASCGDVLVRGNAIRGGLDRVFSPVALRGRDAAARFDLHAQIEPGPLGTGYGPEQHELVEIAEVPDAEQLASHLGKTGAESEVIALECPGDDVRAI